MATLSVTDIRRQCADCGHLEAEHRTWNVDRPCLERHYDAIERKHIECPCKHYRLSQTEIDREINANRQMLKVESCPSCHVAFPLFIDAATVHPMVTVNYLLALIPRHQVPCATWSDRTDRVYDCGCVEHRDHMVPGLITCLAHTPVRKTLSASGICYVCHAPLTGSARAYNRDLARDIESVTKCEIQESQAA